MKDLLLQGLALPLLELHSFAGAVSKSDEALDPLVLCPLPVLLLELLDDGGLLSVVVVVVGVVELVHLGRGSVGVVPDGLLRLVELPVLQELLGHRVARVRNHRVHVVPINRRLRSVVHANKI